MTCKHQDVVCHAVFSPDGSRLLTASNDNTAVLWDAKTGDVLSTLGHDAFVDYAVFSSDGARVATVLADEKKTCVWNANTGARLLTLEHDDWVRHAAFSPDRSKVITEGHNTATVWDAETGTKLSSHLSK